MPNFVFFFGRKQTNEKLPFLSFLHSAIVFSFLSFALLAREENIFLPLRKTKMKNNLVFGFGACTVAGRVEFLWNDKDANGPRGVIQNWIWTQSEESLQTTERPFRRLG